MTNEQQEFTAALTALAALYGRKIDQAGITAYWGLLHRIDHYAVMQALAAVPALHPDWFPTAAQIAEIARERARGKAVREQANETRRLLPAPIDADLYRGRCPPPLDVSEHEAYIKAADKPFERLARQWECERIQSGRDGNATTSRVIGEQRFKDFWATWGVDKVETGRKQDGKKA